MLRNQSISIGPATWNNIAPAANGRRQSPIDIKTKEALYDVKLAQRPLKMQYVPSNSKTLFNNGHTAQVSIDSANSRKYILLTPDRLGCVELVYI